MPRTTRRGVAALLALAGAVPAGVSAASTAMPMPMPNPDERLVRLAAEMASTEAELAVRLAAAKDDEEAVERAEATYSEDIHPLLVEMAATPAATLTGTAAKMGRLCASMSEDCGRSLQVGEPEILDSLTDDLRRLLPVVMAPGGISPHPDAELIAACARYPAVVEAYDTGGGEDGSENPLWLDYLAVREVIDTATPQTMAGVLAKAKAAKWEATHAQLDGEENPDGTAAEFWAYDIVNDLLRLVGGAA